MKELRLLEYSGTPISEELNVSKEEAQECLKQIENSIPEYGSAYFYVDALGQIMCDTWYADTLDRYRFEHGNCFSSKEDAEANIGVVFLRSAFVPVSQIDEGGNK